MTHTRTRTLPHCTPQTTNVHSRPRTHLVHTYDLVRDDKNNILVRRTTGQLAYCARLCILLCTSHHFFDILSETPIEQIFPHSHAHARTLARTNEWGFSSAYPLKIMYLKGTPRTSESDSDKTSGGESKVTRQSREHVYVYIHKHIYIYVYVYIYIHVYVYVYIYTTITNSPLFSNLCHHFQYMYMHIYTYVYMYIHTYL